MRKALFRKFIKENYKIIALQETYLLEDDKSVLQEEWQGEFHLVPGTPNSKGLLTLFDKSIHLNDIKLIYSNERMLTSSVIINNEPVFIYNIYSPCDSTSSKVKFLDNLYTHISNTLFNENDISKFIVLGDFNATLNVNLDIISGEPHQKRLVNNFNNFLHNLQLK